jgi:hypothetical protein
MAAISRSLGRISPEKGVDRAIEIADRAGAPLKIAAKVDKADLVYHNSKIKCLLEGPGVEFIGETSLFRSGARAPLNPATASPYSIGTRTMLAGKAIQTGSIARHAVAVAARTAVNGARFSC